jgi:hypothetical protein
MSRRNAFMELVSLTGISKMARLSRLYMLDTARFSYGPTFRPVTMSQPSLNPGEESRDLVGRVLEICVEEDEPTGISVISARDQGLRLAEVATVPHDLEAGPTRPASAMARSAVPSVDPSSTSTTSPSSAMTLEERP